MFSSSKVSQAMIDAVNSVLGQTKPEPVQEVKTPEEGGRVPFAPAQTLSEASVKIKTATGTKVYGSSYGNSAKAVKDQTRSSVDDIKEPTKKDIEKDAHLYKKTPPSTAKSYDQFGAHWAKEEVEVQEELKGNQDKIDANHNGKIDGQDFKILKGKKKVKEDMQFANKLLETVRKSDVPAYLRKAKGDTPLTVADVKGPKKDSISAPENLAKNRNEEVEQIEERDEGKHNNGKTTGFNVVAAKAAKEYGSKEAGARVAGAIRKKVLAKEDVTEQELDEALNEVLSKDASAGDWIHDFVHSDNPKFAGKSKAERKKMALGAYYGKQNEEVVNHDDAPITTDTLAGRLPGGKVNSFKSYKKKLKGDLEDDGTPVTVAPESTAARRSIKAEEVEQVEEKVIAGTPGWKEMKKDVKDKSGAVHTPMSRAKDLARSAFKKIKNETMMGKAGTTSESK